MSVLLGDCLANLSSCGGQHLLLSHQQLLVSSDYLSLGNLCLRRLPLLLSCKLLLLLSQEELFVTINFNFRAFGDRDREIRALVKELR